MEELKKTIQAIAAKDVETAPVSIGLQRKAHAGLVLNWVRGYLAENPETALELYVYRARPTSPVISVRVTKDSIASAMNSEEFRAMLSGFGDAGLGGLPGQSHFIPRKFRCSICGREVNAIPIDGLPPPMCMNNHPPRHMDAE